MPYYLVENWKGGVDTRNHTYAALPGTLRKMVNCHVTPGGEIEKRKAFARAFWDKDQSDTLRQLALTFGLAELNNDLVVFQDTAVANGGADWGTGDPVLSTPYGDVTLTRQRLAGSDYANAVSGAGPLDTLLSWDVFEGKLYVVAADMNGSQTVQHFYDGARVTSLNAAGQPLLARKIRVFKDKVYGIEDTGIYFSAVGHPTDWSTTGAPATVGGPGYAGFISTSGASSEGEKLTGLEIYYDALAIFSRSGIQIWDMDVDPANNALRQVIRSGGLVGEASPKQYGSGDVLFLSANGIRSLRARDGDLSGAVNDVGSPVDDEIQSLLREDFDQYAGAARAVLEENTGRLWMSFGDRIWVLSQFGSTNVSAWSLYTPERPSGTFTVTDMVQARGMMFLRDSDGTIYAYGGADDATYDETDALVETAHMTMDDPPAVKFVRGLDVIVTGAWDVEFSESPANPDWTPIARVYNSTLGYGQIGFQAITPAVALRFRSGENKRTVLSQVMVHYDLAPAR